MNKNNEKKIKTFFKIKKNNNFNLVRDKNFKLLVLKKYKINCIQEEYHHQAEWKKKEMMKIWIKNKKLKTRTSLNTRGSSISARRTNTHLHLIICYF